MSDDHAYQAISTYRSDLSKLAPTPNINRIAREGATFLNSYVTNASRARATLLNSYVTNSMCGPSRGTMLTDLFSHMHGLTRNGHTFDTRQWVWPRALSETGYQIALAPRPLGRGLGLRRLEKRAEWDRLHQLNNKARNAARMTDRQMALWKYQRFMDEYLGAVASAAAGLGRVLDHLHAAGLSTITLVVCTSDQGFYVEEHGWDPDRRERAALH